MLRVLVTIFLSWALPVSADFSRTYLDSQPLYNAGANGISLAYRSLGDAQRPAVVMIMGLGASHIVWGDDMVRGLRDRGYRLVLLDNRDTGGSTRFDAWGQPTLWWQLIKRALGFAVDAPYTLYDMAGDVVGLMDELDLQEVHLIGASMGGMIAQIVAARYPERTRSLVSIMSTTGAPHLPPPTDEAAESLRGAAVGAGEDAVGRRAEMVARGFDTESMPRQMMAIFKTGDRSAEVSTISRPTLVIHGAEDTLVPPAHGAYTAQLIDGSELVVYEGMGHNFPDEVLPSMLQRIDEHLRAADAGAR